jgi:opacity protein-like surface antigen
MRNALSKILVASLSLTVFATSALAGDAVPADVPLDSDGGTGTPGKVAPPNSPDKPLPKPQSDNDAQPAVASPGLPAGGLVRQAGVGGVTGYGRAGVLELGGSAGVTLASDYRNVNFSPIVGWFIADNLQISGILGISNIKSGDNSSTLWSALAEPSYHLPFNRSTFAFLGLGVGASHISGLGTGFALAPRIGTNLLVGRSGVLTPSLSYEYTTVSADDTMSSDVTTVAVTSSLRFNVGYTAMW